MALQYEALDQYEQQRKQLLDNVYSYLGGEEGDQDREALADWGKFLSGVAIPSSEDVVMGMAYSPLRFPFLEYPNAFRSIQLDRLAEMIKKQNPKGNVIDWAKGLESKGQLKKGFMDYYSLGGWEGLEGMPAENMMEILRSNWVNPVITRKDQGLVAFARDVSDLMSRGRDDLSLVPWAEPRPLHWIDEQLIGSRRNLTGERMAEELRKADLKFDDISKAATPAYGSKQLLFPTDKVFELLLQGRGNTNLGSGPHFRDFPNVLAHIRGQEVDLPGIGKVPIVQEVQSDAVKRERLVKKELYDWLNSTIKREGPSSYVIIDPAGRRGFPARRHGSREEAENALSTAIDKMKATLRWEALPPEVSGNWAETAVQAALKHGAEKGYPAVGFINDTLAVAGRQGYEPSGLYSERIPNFLNKYTKRYGGETTKKSFYVDPPRGPVMWEGPGRPPQGAINFAHITPEFRRFLKGQQPLSILPASLLLNYLVQGGDFSQ